MYPALNAADRALYLLAAAALVLMTVITMISVLGRYLFSAPIPDDLIISEMLIVVLVFLPFSRVQAEDKHVNVTLLTDLMPPRGQAVCELLGLAIGLVFFGLVSVATFGNFLDAWTVGAYFEGRVEFPEWPPRFAVFLGCALLFARLVLDTAGAALRTFRL